jgi:hypothetical protein
MMKETLILAQGDGRRFSLLLEMEKNKLEGER